MVEAVGKQLFIGGKWRDAEGGKTFEVEAALAHPAVADAALGAGFERAAVDPKGFRSGSMNERLSEPGLYR